MQFRILLFLACVALGLSVYGQDRYFSSSVAISVEAPGEHAGGVGNKKATAVFFPGSGDLQWNAGKLWSLPLPSASASEAHHDRGLPLSVFFDGKLIGDSTIEFDRKGKSAVMATGILHIGKNSYSVESTGSLTRKNDYLMWRGLFELPADNNGAMFRIRVECRLSKQIDSRR